MDFNGIEVGKLRCGRTYTKYDLGIDFISPMPKRFKIMEMKLGRWKCYSCIILKVYCKETDGTFTLYKKIRKKRIDVPSAQTILTI